MVLMPAYEDYYALVKLVPMKKSLESTHDWIHSDLFLKKSHSETRLFPASEMEKMRLFLLKRNSVHRQLKWPMLCFGTMEHVRVASPVQHHLNCNL